MLTVILHVALRLVFVSTAVIVAVPALTPVTTPLAVTVTTAVLEEVNFIVLIEAFVAVSKAINIYSCLRSSVSDVLFRYIAEAPVSASSGFSLCGAITCSIVSSVSSAASSAVSSSIAGAASELLLSSSSASEACTGIQNIIPNKISAIISSGTILDDFPDKPSILSLLQLISLLSYYI